MYRQTKDIFVGGAAHIVRSVVTGVNRTTLFTQAGRFEKTDDTPWFINDRVDLLPMGPTGKTIEPIFVRRSKETFLVQKVGRGRYEYYPMVPNKEMLVTVKGADPKFSVGSILEVKAEPRAPWECREGGDFRQSLHLSAPAHFVRFIGERHNPQGELQIALHRYALPYRFSPEALAEARSLPDHVAAQSRRGRVDLRDLPFVTIDGEDARDFDDAVYCRENEDGWRLLVAIADVSHYVKPNRPLDRDAQERATSIYFPSTVIPMLPEKLSNGLCSLNPHEDRLTMVCDAMIDRQGKTTAYQFYPAVIHSHARLTYTRVWQALQGRASGLRRLGERLPEIARLYRLFTRLHAQRKRRGALDFHTTELQAIFLDDGTIDRFQARSLTDANRLIEECMLVANTCAADFVLRHEAMTLFRNHDKPNPLRLQELSMLLRPYRLKIKSTRATDIADLLHSMQRQHYEDLESLVLRAMARAEYAPDNIGHFGLQYRAYAHFTSPIRRYPDLLLHRTIKGILHQQNYVPKYYAQDEQKRPAQEKLPALTRKEKQWQVWADLGEHCSFAERRADRASRSVMKYLACRWMERYAKNNRRMPATITGMSDYGLFARLDEFGIEGFIPLRQIAQSYVTISGGRAIAAGNKRYRVGTSVRVRVTRIDYDLKRITFSIL